MSFFSQLKEYYQMLITLMVVFKRPRFKIKAISEENSNRIVETVG